MLHISSGYSRHGGRDLRSTVGLLDTQLAALVAEALQADKASLVAATHLGQTPPDAPPGYAHTRDRYEVQLSGALSGRLVMTAPQFAFQIRDTAAHGPVTAQALHFFDGGTAIFAKRVKGTTANAALVKALEHQAQTVEAVVVARTPELRRALGG